MKWSWHRAFHKLRGDRTLRVVSAVLFSLGVITLFQHLPGWSRWPARLLCLGALGWLVHCFIQTVRAASFSGKKLVFSLILGALFYVTLSLLCQVFIKFMSTRDERIATHVITSLAEEHRTGIKLMLEGASYELYDRDVGWVPRPGHGSKGELISRQGLRSLREYAIPAPDPSQRILCLGDSFTYGDCVGDTETYPYHAEQLCPGTEWINLGITGACLTQALLHYRKTGRKFGGKHVVIGFMTDDAKRSVNCFRPFVTMWNPFTKPFAKYSDGVFSIEPNPYQDINDYRKLLANEGPEIARLLKLDYLTWSHQVAARNPILHTAEYAYEIMNLDRSFDALLGRMPKKVTKKKTAADPYAKARDPYGRILWDPAQQRWKRSEEHVDPYGRAIWRPDSLGFIALTRLFDLFYKEVIADGRVPLIVIIPGPLDVENHTKHLPKLYEALIDHFEVRHYRYFDFLDPLVAAHQDDLSPEALFVIRHYNSGLNKELAAEIIKALHLPAPPHGPVHAKAIK